MFGSVKDVFIRVFPVQVYSIFRKDSKRAYIFFYSSRYSQGLEWKRCNRDEIILKSPTLTYNFYDSIPQLINNAQALSELC